MVNIYTVRSFFKARLGFDPHKEFSALDWLIFPQQRLLELTSGAVYHDGLGELEKIRTKLKYYPRDVWLYMLAALLAGPPPPVTTTAQSLEHMRRITVFVATPRWQIVALISNELRGVFARSSPSVPRNYRQS